MVTLNSKTTLLPPVMPNFIRLSSPVFKMEGGYAGSNCTIPITDLSPEEAESYGQLMKDEFIKHYQSKKKKP